MTETQSPCSMPLAGTAGGCMAPTQKSNVSPAGPLPCWGAVLRAKLAESSIGFASCQYPVVRGRQGGLMTDDGTPSPSHHGDVTVTSHLLTLRLCLDYNVRQTFCPKKVYIKKLLGSYT